MDSYLSTSLWVADAVYRLHPWMRVLLPHPHPLPSPADAGEGELAGIYAWIEKGPRVWPGCVPFTILLSNTVVFIYFTLSKLMTVARSSLCHL
jgi:hypothetical protein